MQTATGRLIIGMKNSDIKVEGVTPAQAQVYIEEFQSRAGTMPLGGMVLTEDIQRSSADEMARLRAIHRKDVMDKLFPGKGAKAPERFDEVFDAEQMKQVGLTKE